MSNKLYFSHCFDPEHWKDDGCGILNVLLIPKRWWSIKEWKFALSLRSRFLEHMMKMIGQKDAS